LHILLSKLCTAGFVTPVKFIDERSGNFVAETQTEADDMYARSLVFICFEQFNNQVVVLVYAVN
jgi:hypothetical protein